MEPARSRDVVTMNPANEILVTDHVGEYAAPGQAVLVEQAPAQATDVVSVRSIRPHAVAAGLMATAMIVWGGVVMARAGFDNGLREPLATVFGLTANALSGIIITGLGLMLLLSALETERAAIMFSSIVIGIGSLIVMIEPNVANGALGIDRAVPALLAFGSAVVLFLAAVVPTMTNRTRTIERV